MRRKKTFSIVDFVMMIFNILSLLLLLSSYIAVFVNPAKNYHFVIAGMAYPYFLILNFCFVVFWILRRNNKKYLYSLVLILAGCPFLLRYYSCNSRETSASPLKVMSYNVQMFGAYNNDLVDSMLEVISDKDVKIACLQEFCQKKYSGTLSLLLKSNPDFKYMYPNFLPTDYYLGNVILSAYPIIESGVLGHSKLLNKNTAVYADILFGKDTIRVYNLHLCSNLFQKEDYDFANKISVQHEKYFEQGYRRISNKIRIASKERSVQADSIAGHIKKSPYPVVVCGDFNDTPWSYTYQILKTKLNDAHVRSGFGRGHSFILNNFLRFRIDYILYSKSLCSWHTETLHKKASDHFPVLTTLGKVTKSEDW